jgi:hypothetical protein
MTRFSGVFAPSGICAMPHHPTGFWNIPRKISLGGIFFLRHPAMPEEGCRMKIAWEDEG